MRRRTLGKGLGELISGEALAQARVVLEVPIRRLAPNPLQPRMPVNPEDLEDLTVSIEAHGVLQPIMARRVGEDYEIIAGERRWRAAQRAGLETVPCIVQDATDEEALQLALIENLQREDLSPIEAARGYRRLLDEFGLNQEQLGRLIGKSRPAIANTLRLLDLPAEVQEAIQAGQITEGHGRALLGLGPDHPRLLDAFKMVVESHLTVRDVEDLVREAMNPPPQAPAAAPATPRRADPNLVDAQVRIQGALAVKVRIRPNARGGGKVELRYSNADELERLIDLLTTLR